MTEIRTIKKIRNKANAKKLMGVLIIPIPFDVYLERIQGIPHNKVAIRGLQEKKRTCH